jgi:hypothetical protein
MQELHQCRLLAPWLLKSRAANDGTGIQRAGLGLQVDLGVDVRGVKGYVLGLIRECQHPFLLS